MEKKKSGKTPKKATTKMIKKISNKRKENIETKKAFTLIELLAVIIILGILMIIAIPSVTKYISDSRKSAYVDTAKQLISSARIFVNEGKVQLYDPTATYYIPTSCLKVENGKEAESPYGKFANAYVIVTFEGQNYNYYWKSVDNTGTGIKNITAYDDLDIDLIKSDLEENDVDYREKVSGKAHVILLDANTNCSSQIIIPEEVPEDNGPKTTDHITWTYIDLSVSVDAHLNNCNIQGDYRMCYGATMFLKSLEEGTVIRSFVASFDVPEGTELIKGADDSNKAIVELNGTKLTITGNPSGGAQNYITANGIETGFQIKIPKDAEILLLNCQIEYDLVSSNTQEGNSSGGQGTLENMDGVTSDSTLRVVLNRFHSYQNGGSNVTIMQYNVEVTNNTNNPISNWSFILEAPESVTNIYSYSGLQVSKSGNIYTLTPYDYTGYTTLNGKQKATFNNSVVIETTNSSQTPTIK